MLKYESSELRNLSFSQLVEHYEAKVGKLKNASSAGVPADEISPEAVKAFVSDMTKVDSEDELSPGQKQFWLLVKSGYRQYLWRRSLN
jgi:hypothetical protein